MKTHNLYLLILIVNAISFSSCLLFRKPPPLPKEVVLPDDEFSDSIPLTSFTVQMDSIPTRFVMFSLEKTYCYGICPEFKVDFYNDGRVVYRGFEDVEKLGDFEAQVDEKTLQALRTAAERADYFRLHNYYPEKGEIMDDLPVTITSADFIYKTNRVTNAHHSPVNLHRFERELMYIIDRLDWKPLGQGERKSNP